jgi:unsaturated chondroitin disaccharide hydrolase
MIQINSQLNVQQLQPMLEKLFEVSGPKILKLAERWKKNSGSPVFTVNGQYTARGWTEWTQGFQFGSALLQYEVTPDATFLEIGRRNTVDKMAGHLTHIGVHDHGFNNVSTYGNLLRQMHEGTIEYNPWEKNFYELALKVSGAVQASRWTSLGAGQGYIYSFNGPHSLFSDTIRSLRALAVSDHLGHVLMGEKDQAINLFHRLLEHAETTARYNVYFGSGRDSYDIRGRVVHESIFNLNDKSYRCPSSQQGYSPFSTWTRGLAWIMLGFAEQLEYLATLPEERFSAHGGKAQVLSRFAEVAEATSDFYIQYTPTDGIPYWDTGAPGLAYLGNYLDRPAEPYNDYEPVDSSAAVIAAQGLLRLGNYLMGHDQPEKGRRYFQAGLTVSKTVLSEPYLSTDLNHEGLIVHSVYHRPNGWDRIPEGRKVPADESSQWGDYHAHELALLLWREATGKPYLTFFNSFFE